MTTPKDPDRPASASADASPEERVRRAATPDFWDTLYATSDTGWDLGAPSPVLRAALDLGLLGPPGHVLVPGAGNGHDALLLARQGHTVTAVDFASSPVAHLRDAAARENLPVTALQQDVFTLADGPAARFDAAFEYTCFVAIDPARRDDYVRMLTHVVRPGGRLLFLAFPIGRTAPGPPHGLTLEELRVRFGPAWHWVLESAAPVSPSARAESERLVLLERRD